MREPPMFDLDAAPVFIALAVVAYGLNMVMKSRQTQKFKRLASEAAEDAHMRDAGV